MGQRELEARIMMLETKVKMLATTLAQMGKMIVATSEQVEGVNKIATTLIESARENDDT